MAADVTAISKRDAFHNETQMPTNGYSPQPSLRLDLMSARVFRHQEHRGSRRRFDHGTSRLGRMAFQRC